MPRYEKAQVKGKIKRNVIPIEIRNRETIVPIKNVRKPSSTTADPSTTKRSLTKLTYQNCLQNVDQNCHVTEFDHTNTIKRYFHKI